MSKYWVSGANTSERVGTSTLAENLLGATITSGRVLWLTAVILPTVSACTSTTEIYIYDGATGGSMVTSTTAKRMMFMPLTTTEGVPKDNVVEIPMPGMKFSTGCVFTSDGTALIEIGNIGGCGYEV